VICIETLEDEEHIPQIELRVRGLTCLCPVNGSTDTFDVSVAYTPMRGRVLELGAFRTSLDRYATRAITHEALTLEVMQDIVELIHPSDVQVATFWEPVEGVECVVRVVS
jgi:NADPH-dependent 7-cyano-7-deazaguanine reductase QueF